jgi:hypothetical protein
MRICSLILLALLFAGLLGCGRTDNATGTKVPPAQKVTPAQIERTYAERIHFKILENWDEAWPQYVTPEMRARQSELDRDIEMLDESTIAASLEMFKKMDAWTRYWYGSVLLTHYDKAVLPMILDEFDHAQSAVLRGAFLQCVRETSLERKQYDKNTLAILSIALADIRDCWPLSLPSGESMRISDLAFTIAEGIVHSQHLPELPPETDSGDKARAEKLRALGDWLRRNFKFMCIDPLTHKFSLDENAAAQGLPSKHPATWPPETTRGELKLPQRLDELRIPKPGS